MNAHQLKGLQTRLLRLNEEKVIALEAMRRAEKNVRSLEQQIVSIQKEITTKRNGLTERGVLVSEHAMLRFLERVKGVNLELLRTEILGGSEGKGVLPDGSYPMGSFCIKVKANVVTTVTLKD